MRSANRNGVFAQPWIWSYLGALLVWLAAIVFTRGYGAGGMITAGLALAVFSVITGVAQMFVITLGPGNVDLSLPANIGLASAVAMKVMGGSDSMIAVGLLAALCLRRRNWNIQIIFSSGFCASHRLSRPFPLASSFNPWVSATVAVCRSSRHPPSPTSLPRKSQGSRSWRSAQ